MRKLGLLIFIFGLFVILSGNSCNSKKNAISGNKTNQDQTTVVKTEQNTDATPQTPVNQTTNTDEEKVIILTTETFKQKVFDYTTNTEWNYLGDKPCIIDFYADWCRPCKMIEPYLNEVAKDYAGKIYVYRINVDENQEVASVFGIQSIPSVLFIPMEGQPQMAIGARPKDFYYQAVKDVLKVQ